MPLRWFRCPDGKMIDKDKCLEHCRMTERCMTKATLLLMAKDRDWDGTAHVTNLLNGTMQEFLQIVHDYAVDPQSLVFALLGSTHHKLMEDESMGRSEIPLKWSWLQGTADRLEVEGAETTLFDYKTWGSYKVQKALGLVQDRLKQWRRTGTPDLLEVSLQVNMYRLMLELNEDETPTGLVIDKMKVQATVRDNSTQMSRQRGLDRNLYLINIPRFPDSSVLEYFHMKADKLEQSLDSGEPERCTQQEAWDGRKCTGYCPVAQFCYSRWDK